MSTKDLVVVGLFVVLVILSFAIWLETQRVRLAGEYGNQLLSKLIELRRARIAVETRQTVAAEREAYGRMVAEAARGTFSTAQDQPAEDGDAHDRPTVFYEVTKVSAAVPALGEDEEDDTRRMTRVGPPPVRKL